ncbi:hypothetical protein RIF29_10936 [Crotalaria pallida]|uniref:Uncharacterized protein n=1 Tax=Crotalaria pallida TaxID=3830 RepID=A0AAN9FZF0_CROPI
MNVLLEKEELLLKQRSKVHWLKERDKNTKFFHQRASQRHQKNTIKHLKNSQNVLCVEEEEMGAIAVEYFSSLFETGNPPLEHVVLEAVNSKSAQS